MSETATPAEAIIPAEVKLSTLETTQRHSAESVVKKIKVVDDKGRKKILYYKRPTEGAFTTVVRSPLTGQSTETPTTPLGHRTVEAIAQIKKDEYESARICFGEKHVARTLFVVGEDTTTRDNYLNAESEAAKDLIKEPNNFGDNIRKHIRETAGLRPQIHVYQEPVIETLWHAVGVQTAIEKAVKQRLIADPSEANFKEKRADLLSKIKQKGLIELDQDDPIEGPIRKGLEKYQAVLKDFYPWYVESALMGFIPDLGFLNPDPYDEVDAGLLFSQNTGIYVNDKGEAMVKLIDFGVPRFDVLTVASRKRLRSLIEEKKRQGELPIYIVKDEYITEYSSGNKYSIKSKMETRQLSEWYRQALMYEITESLLTRGSEEMIGVEKNSTVEDIFEKIETIVLSDPNGFHNRYRLELESFRRLCGAEVYGTKMRRVITHIKDSETIGKGVLKSDELKIDDSAAS